MEIFWQILKNWWWFFFPLIFFFPFRFFYFWWMQWEVYYKKAFKWILLEIKPPREVKKPFSAMENIFSMLWGIIDSGNWRERWCNGALPLGYGGWFSFEICSFGGEIHFFMRIPAPFENAAKTAIFSQYPDTEISIVEDYTKKVPQNVPNEKWDFYCNDYTLARPDHFPIKTYTMFFERPEEEKRVIEEKRLDPMDALLEGLSKLQSGEQIWIQIVCNPITDSLFPWQEKGRAEADKIAKRPGAKKPKSFIGQIFETSFSFIGQIFEILFSFIGQIFEILFSGISGGQFEISFSGKQKKEEAKPLELIAPELRLTPVEKEILTGIENKLKKTAYQCWIRLIHIYKKDEPHNPGSYKLVHEYFISQFATNHLNFLTYFGGTRARIHYWIKGRRLYLRKRQGFKHYVERMPSYFPWNFRGEPPPLLKLIRYRIAPGIRATCILNIEELATLFHFPTRIILPTVPRVEVKKVGPPPTLP